MTRARGERLARAVVLGLGVVCLTLIALLRDPARAGAPEIEPARPTTSAGALPPAGGAPAESGTRAVGIAFRLTDLLSSAVVDAPELARVDRELDYWRRMRSPYAGPVGELGRAVQQVALVKRNGRRDKKGTPASLALDPHVWNTSDGSFDQREAILAPPPSRMRFPSLVLPAGAVLETAPAVLGAKLGGAELEVAVVRDGGERSVVGTRRLDGSERSFSEWRVDLARFAGKPVTLELVTRALVPMTSPAVVWGSPVVLAPGATDFPFNVLFIVVDALRGDALSAGHDATTDARMAAVSPPPLEAWLPNMPEVAPNLDALAARGVIFTRARSAATWTRPGTIAMMAGAPSSELGLGALKLVPEPADVRALYARRPPFLPLLLRPHGVASRAVVNNFYMVGYSGVGIDMGFEGLVDHRYAVEDTTNILSDAVAELERQRDRRFFLFVNFNSPHVPYQPPPSAKAAIPKPPRGPKDRLVRAYLAEIHKDDAAIGVLMDKLDSLGLSERTVVVVTGDHGETLSAEHDGVPEGVDGGPAIGGRFHHLSSLYDETAHVPLILVLPKTLPAGKKIAEPVSTIDIVPTLLDLAGLEQPSSVSGVSLLPLTRGQSVPERPLVIEGRGAHSLRVGRWRLNIRDAAFRTVRIRGKRTKRPYDLYDLEADPGERVEVSRQHPDVVTRLAKLDKERRARASETTSGDPPVLRLRFTTAGAARHVTGHLAISGGSGKVSLRPVGLPADSARSESVRADVDFTTAADSAVGFDVTTEPPSADLEWGFSLDGAPWPSDGVYSGDLALLSSDLATGLHGAAARLRATAEAEPFIDATRDLGLFVTRDRGAREIEIRQNDAAKDEAMGLMRAWGYVRDEPPRAH